MNRRRYLGLAAGVAGAGLAGCTSSGPATLEHEWESFAMSPAATALGDGQWGDDLSTRLTVHTGPDTPVGFNRTNLDTAGRTDALALLDGVDWDAEYVVAFQRLPMPNSNPSEVTQVLDQDDLHVVDLTAQGSSFGGGDPVVETVVVAIAAEPPATVELIDARSNTFTTSA